MPEKRKLTAGDETIIEELYRRKYLPTRLAVEGRSANPRELLPTHAYVTTTEPVVMRRWQGHGNDPEFIDDEVPAGRTLKVVMISRFGDFGLTDDLNAEHGYQARIEFESLAIKDLRWEP